MSVAKLQMVDLPEGVTKLEQVDEGVGPMLRIDLEDGLTLILDGLCLGGQHRFQVGLFRTADWDECGSEKALAGMNFDRDVPPEVAVYPDNASWPVPCE